jgi:hypothetical protein
MLEFEFVIFYGVATVMASKIPSSLYKAECLKKSERRGILSKRSAKSPTIYANGESPTPQMPHRAQCTPNRGGKLQKPLPNGSVGSTPCIPTVRPSGSFLTPTLSIDRRRYVRMRRILGSTCYLSPRADGGAPATGPLRIWGDERHLPPSLSPPLRIRSSGRDVRSNCHGFSDSSMGSSNHSRVGRRVGACHPVESFHGARIGTVRCSVLGPELPS